MRSSIGRGIRRRRASLEALRRSADLAELATVAVAVAVRRPNAPLTGRCELAMQPRISLITLGVDDLERSVRFWRDGMGLSTEGIVGQQFEHGAVAFFDLNPGLKLALWPRRDIAHDSGLPVGPVSPTEFTLAHNVASRAEVDAVLAQAVAAGAALVKPAADTFYGGYAAYFRDPDGHLWEIAWNPSMPPDV